MELSGSILGTLKHGPLKKINKLTIQKYITSKRVLYKDPSQTVKKLIHCEREGSGGQDPPEFIPQAEFISAEENPVFLRPDKVQGFPQK